MRLAVKARQANAVETAERELDEGFLALVDALDGFFATSGLTQSDGRSQDALRSPLTRVDRDIESFGNLPATLHLGDPARHNPDTRRLPGRAIDAFCLAKNQESDRGSAADEPASLTGAAEPQSPDDWASWR